MAHAMAMTSQACMAALLFSGRAEVWMLGGLMGVNGLAMALHGESSSRGLPPPS